MKKKTLFLLASLLTSTMFYSQNKGLVVRCESKTMQDIMVKTLAVLDTLAGDTVSIYVYNKSGQKVATIIENEVIDGHERVEFKDKHIADDYYYGVVETEKGKSTFGILKNSTQIAKEDNIIDEMVELYPNPTLHSISVKTSLDLIDNLYVYSLSGEKLMEASNVRNKDVFDLSTFDKGTYIFMFIHEGKSFVKQVVKS